MKKFMYLVISLLVVVLFGFSIFSLVNKSKSSVNNSSEQYDKIIAQYGDIWYASYDNSTASGSEIIDIIKKLSSDDTILVEVTNGYVRDYSRGEGIAPVSPVIYSSALVNAPGSTLLDDMVNKTKMGAYINPSASFKSSISVDANGIITKISFVQQ